MTVSRVINRSGSVSVATRDRVLLAIEKLHYTPSSIARALAHRRVNRLGVLVDDATQFGPNSTLRAFETAARRAGYTIVSLTATGTETTFGRSAAEHLDAQDVDALCVIAPRVASLALLAERPRVSTPVVAVKPIPHPDIHTVGVDQRLGSRLAVAHLIELGHRSIAHLAGPDDWYDAREREAGWREGLRSAGLHPLGYGVGDWTSESGFAFAMGSGFGKATAIFAANDQMALGILHGLRVRGIRVPQDMSVVGFDDLSDAAHFIPPLTTVRQDFQGLGELAVETTIGALAGEAGTSHRALPPELVVRSSTSTNRGAGGA
jgi:DNA-binding LacI/PurR family transcriptional regulator